MNKLDALKKEWKNQKFDLQLTKDELHQLTQKSRFLQLNGFLYSVVLNFLLTSFFHFLFPIILKLLNTTEASIFIIFQS